jgi:hypothetical protein
MKELFRCTDAIAHIRVSPLVARTKKPCRFSHGRSRGRTIIKPWRWHSRPRGRMVAFPLDSPSEALGAP